MHARCQLRVICSVLIPKENKLTVTFSWIVAIPCILHKRVIKKEKKMQLAVWVLVFKVVSFFLAGGRHGVNVTCFLYTKVNIHIYI